MGKVDVVLQVRQKEAESHLSWLQKEKARLAAEIIQVDGWIAETKDELIDLNLLRAEADNDE